MEDDLKKRSDLWQWFLCSMLKFCSWIQHTEECTDRLKTKSKVVAASRNSSEFPIVILKWL